MNRECCSLLPLHIYIRDPNSEKRHKVNRECCSPYYAILVKTDREAQKASFQDLLTGLRRFSAELEKSPGEACDCMDVCGRVWVGVWVCVRVWMCLYMMCVFVSVCVFCVCGCVCYVCGCVCVCVHLRVHVT